jgi:hypothetical protein
MKNLMAISILKGGLYLFTYRTSPDHYGTGWPLYGNCYGYNFGDGSREDFGSGCGEGVRYGRDDGDGTGIEFGENPPFGDGDGSAYFYGI